MLIVLSPAKTLDYETALPLHQPTKPRMLNDSAQLIERASKLNEDDIKSLMKVSDKIAKLNKQRFSNWHTPFTKSNARAAIFAFKGDVYTGLDIESFSSDDLKNAQKYLRILSGLYGVLRPLDLMQAYRLEMGTKLDTARGKNLYEFWGEKITQQIQKDMNAVNTDILVNLASQEYFKSIKTDQLNAQVIEPVFEDEKNGKYKVIAFWAKKARGKMASWIIKNNITSAKDLKKYNEDGYSYSAQSSTDNRLVFRRAEK